MGQTISVLVVPKPEKNSAYRLIFRSTCPDPEGATINLSPTFTFRILTPDQDEFLNGVKDILTQDFESRSSPSSLLWLAQVYQDFDQNSESLKALIKLKDAALLSDPQATRLENMVRAFGNALDVLTVLGK